MAFSASVKKNQISDGGWGIMPELSSPFFLAGKL